MSRRATSASTPYSRAAYIRFSFGDSFLKKAASTLTRLISRLTAISSRTMSWPKTATRPCSTVSSVLTNLMKVDLPLPLAPSNAIDLAALDAQRDVVDRDDGLALLAPADLELLAQMLDVERCRSGNGGHR